MLTLLIIVHVFMCIALILIVLLQTGKGAEMGAAFGGASQTVFGGAGPAPFLSKITTVAAIIFMITSLGLAYLSSNPLGGSIMDDAAPGAASQVEETVPPLDTGAEPSPFDSVDAPPATQEVPEAVPVPAEPQKQ